MLAFFGDFSVSLNEMIVLAQQDFGLQIFREVEILASWRIWKHRNAIIFYGAFDGAALSLDRWKQSFKDEFGLVLHRVKPSVKHE
ncbi:hypothetical protein HU200_032388 [Digitaria exilis]|uniref:Uncharacterized protein n=1 Tax=Digitaria exilis TaxID=1010633 RepID=A0A835EPP7_9POAL|nr:hypothetical protein HU200_032388 [Digitaria exilis]